MTKPSPQRTPADLKWLLNERAALAGVVEKAQHRLARDSDRISTTQRTLLMLTEKVEHAREALLRQQSQMEALDIAISLMYAEANPGAGGTVHAWKGLYGVRGGLKIFIRDTLQKVTPEALSMTALLSLVILRFNLQVDTPQQRRIHTATLRNVLSRLEGRGLVEAIHVRHSHALGMWRWKQPQSLADLAAKAAALQPVQEPHDVWAGTSPQPAYAP